MNTVHQFLRKNVCIFYIYIKFTLYFLAVYVVNNNFVKYRIVKNSFSNFQLNVRSILSPLTFEFLSILNAIFNAIFNDLLHFTGIFLIICKKNSVSLFLYNLWYILISPIFKLLLFLNEISNRF